MGQCSGNGVSGSYSECVGRAYMFHQTQTESGKILMSDGELQMEQLPAEAYGDRHPSVSITCIISPDSIKSHWGGMCVYVPLVVFCTI